MSRTEVSRIIAGAVKRMHEHVDTNDDPRPLAT